jgi:hypothetical protein
MEREHLPNTPKKHLETHRSNIAHQKQNLKDGINQLAPSLLHLATGHTESSTQVAMLLGVVAGAALHMGEGGKSLTYILVYILCDQKDPGDTTVWKQQHTIQYSEDTPRVGKIDPHKQTLVNLEYYIHELRNKGHYVAIFIDANQNDILCYRLQGHTDQFKSKTGFNIDGRVDGSLKTFLENTGLSNALNNKHGPETSLRQGNLVLKSEIMCSFHKGSSHTSQQLVC